MEIAEIRPHLWRWTAPHPDWKPEEGGPDGWEQDVASFALVEGDDLVLFDPLVPSDDEERFWRNLDADVEHHGPAHVLLTCSWHARSAAAILERYGETRVWVPAAGADDARKEVAVTDVYAPGDALPGSVHVHRSDDPEDAVLWLPSHGALVFGDSLVGASDGGVRIPETWLREGVTPQMVREALRPLLDLPVELVLVTHGAPVLEDGHAALEQALRD